MPFRVGVNTFPTVFEAHVTNLEVVVGSIGGNGASGLEALIGFFVLKKKIIWSHGVSQLYQTDGLAPVSDWDAVCKLVGIKVRLGVGTLERIGTMFGFVGGHGRSSGVVVGDGKGMAGRVGGLLLDSFGLPDFLLGFALW